MMQILYVLMILSFMFCAFRFVRGPSHLDRILALDLMSLLVMGMMTIYSVEFDDTFLLDVVWIPAVTSFICTVLLAHFSTKIKEFPVGGGQ
ncbi:MAG: monovalent cation/H+ antiporter complex subunit F [Pseudobdellovibrionaceae bacterium]